MSDSLKIEVLFILYEINDGKGWLALTDSDILIYNMGNGDPTSYGFNTHPDIYPIDKLERVRRCAYEAGFKHSSLFDVTDYLNHLVNEYRDTPGRRIARRFVKGTAG